MVSDLGELIARYEAAKLQVEQVIDSGSDSEADLVEADRNLSRAFDDLIQSDLHSGRQSIQRLRYLLTLIEESQPGNGLIKQLADRIWQDVLELDQDAGDAEDNPRNGTK
ncbi:MAG: hypothetical protein ABJM29_06650 [Rhizobiaceae bacterium]